MIPSMQMNAQTRAFSVAYNVKSKFEAAYEIKMEGLSKVQQKV
jgi:hypothetical protein